MSLCSLASRVEDEAMNRRGAVTYSAALMQLNLILQDPQVAASNETVIPAIVLMSLFEQFNGFSNDTSRTQSRNWFAHIQGVARLLQMRGPNGFGSDKAFMTLVASQLSQFASAFAARRSTFLARPEWRTEPWRDRKKTPRDLLFDVVFPIPGILETADVALSLNSVDLILEAIEALSNVRLKLGLWQETYRSRLPARLANLMPESDILPDRRLSVDAAVMPANDLDIMDSMLLFWAVETNIMVNMRALMMALSPDLRNNFSESNLDPVPNALAILRVVPLYIKYGGIVGSQVVMYPLGAVRNYLDRVASVENPDLYAVLGQLLRHAVKDMAHARFLEGFLAGIPAIRGESGNMGYSMLISR